MSKHAGNFGRESLGFLHWIIENYVHLSEMECICFTQGSLNGVQASGMRPDDILATRLPAWASVGPLSRRQLHVIHDACGRPHMNGLGCFQPLLQSLHVAPTARYSTFMGGFFIVRARAVRRLPLSSYWMLVYEHLGCGCIDSTGTKRERHQRTVPYMMEILWKPLFSCTHSCDESLDRPRLPPATPVKDCWRSRRHSRGSLWPNFTVYKLQPQPYEAVYKFANKEDATRSRPQ